GCGSPTDPSERGSGTCDNGVDDDDDGFTDNADGGCMNPTDTDEHCSGAGCPACDNGTDDDADTFVDHRIDGNGDPGCTDRTNTSEQGLTTCDDGMDNDG